MRRWITNQVIKHTPALAKLAHAPLIGPSVRAIGNLLVPREKLEWVQIKVGPATGLWIKANPRIGAALYRGEAEQPVQSFLSQNLRPEMVFYDLGANCGFFSLLAARIVGSRGHVFPFEPERELAARVRENMARNGFQQFTVTEAAVWRESGTVDFARADISLTPDRGTGQIRASASEKNVVALPAVALDDFVKMAPPPNFIKCDVEGAESAVFAGAQQVLQSCRPIVVCEIHSAENDRDVRAMFSRLNYRAADLDENHITALPR
jgi:FkbM family methyltransferase